MPSAPSPITLLDGALGTTLETLSPHAASIIKTSPLWASDPRLVNEVEGVHRGFLDVGAGVVGSSTYQSSDSLYQNFDPVLTPTEIADHMRRGVLIARDAIGKYENDNKVTGEAKGETSGSGSRRKPVVGLCLGPYGATLSPGQEYGGVYPSPFGPNLSTSPTSSSSASSRPPPTSSHLTALTDFHLSRLRTFAQDASLEDSAWRSIEWICFETVPILVEAVAIRVAMAKLEQELEGLYADDDGLSKSGKDRPWWSKKFWITFVYPSTIGGRSPDGTTNSDRMEAMLSSDGGILSHLLESSREHVDESEGASPADSSAAPELALPDGLGVNCTSPAYVGQIVDEMTDAVVRRRSGTSSDDEDRSKAPAMVIYPDGGLVYDTLTRTWSVPPATTTCTTTESSWAKNVAGVSRKAASAKDGSDSAVWSEVLVGGCCKAGFDEIRGLAEELRKD